MMSIILALGALATVGCPNHQKPKPGVSKENLLPIPPLGTKFVYEGEKLNWSLQPHPRILARPQGIEFLRANPQSDVAQTLLGAAELFKAQAASDPNFREATAPLAWAWGYVLTGDESYLQLVRGTLPALMKFPPIVKVPEGANIPFLYQAVALGGVYDLLYDDLSETERKDIEKVLRETVFHTLAYKVTEYDKDINFWAKDPDTNYYVTFHSTAGLVAVVLDGVEPDAEALAEHCRARIGESMDAFASENGWREGLTYLDFCWGQFACYFLLALERNTDLKPYDEQWFEAGIPWSEWGALPDRKTIACFGDNEPENYSVGSWLYRVGVLTGRKSFIEEARATAEAIKGSQAPEEMQHLAFDLPVFEASCIGRPPTEAAYLETLNTGSITRYIPGIEWGFLRSGPSGKGWENEDDFYCAFKSGIAGYDHNHLDQGSLIMAAYSEILLSDPGRGGPDIIRQDPKLNCLFEAGLGHNTLIAGDGCFPDLQLFPDNPKYFARPGEITSREVTDQYVQYTTNNSGLYPTESLTDFRRTFLYIRPGVIPGAQLGAMILADRVAFQQGSEKQHSFLFHTPGEVELAETGVAVLRNGGARLDYYGFCSVPTADKSLRQETTWSIRDSTCYYRSTKDPAKASDWVHVLIPARADGPATPGPEIVASGFGIKVKWEGYEVTLMLKPVVGWVYAVPPE